MAVKITAGELKRSVVLKRPTITRNSEGGKEPSYTDVVTVRAKIDGTSERLQALAPALLDTDTVYFRYAEDRKDIGILWLLNYNGQDHVIHSVEFLGTEKNSFLKVICKARG